MAEVEVVLTFTPSTLEANGPTVTLGRTHAPEVLQVVRDRLLEEAAEEAAQWREADPTLGAMRTLEAERMAKLLAIAVPDAGLRQNSGLVDPTKG